MLTTLLVALFVSVEAAWAAAIVAGFIWLFTH
jgi:hypothetical protein